MEYEYLKECTWGEQESYVFFYDKANPLGDYCVYSRHRDSEILTNCNYDIILKELKKISDVVYDFRVNHWAVGWVEYIIVPKDCQDITLEKAEELLCSLAEYPVLDDEKYSNLQLEAKDEYWKTLDTKERIDYIKENNGNIFAARHDYITETADPSGFMFETMFY